MSQYTDLQRKLAEISSGAPIGTLDNLGKGYGRDARGFLYRFTPVEQDEERRRIARQKAEGRKEGFVFNVMENLPYVASALTSAQCGYLLVLSTYIKFGSDGVIIRGEREAEPMNQADMMKALKLRDSQRSTLTDFLASCIDYGIMRKEGDAYAINDGFHIRGNAPSDRVVRSYITKLREMAIENKPEQIGFIYKLLPYIHKTTNMLCANPNEMQPSAVVKLNRKQIAEVAGVSPTYVTTLTGRMTYNGKSVFAKITTSTDGTFYMLNPAIFRRADRDDYDMTTRGIFGID